MTIQAWWLLTKLKSAQKYKDAYFGIDRKNMIIRTLYVEPAYVKKVKLRGYQNSLESTLNHLVKCGYIDYDIGGCGRVLHEGWHWGQVTAGKVASFLFRSIAVPVAVSFITALITMWLSGSL